ncbi:MAG: hypothetical protein A4S09_03870 [Proteobacteria bacterium SG_bin7]|nr:MAG: hypothetical protein A4S09_03870 [Proteobacteria bacterium SG_bin7]
MIATRPKPFKRRQKSLWCFFRWIIMAHVLIAGTHNAFLMNGQFSNVDCPGVAYLAAYWLGRVNEFISGEE